MTCDFIRGSERIIAMPSLDWAKIKAATQTQRLDRPLDVGVEDRGVDRDGNHYHDWYRNDRRDRQ